MDPFGLYSCLPINAAFNSQTIIDMKKKPDKEKIEQAAFFWGVYIFPLVSDLEFMGELVKNAKKEKRKALHG